MDAFSTIPAPFPSASMVNSCMEKDIEEKGKDANVEEEETMTCDNQQQGDWEKDSSSDSSDGMESIGAGDLFALASSFKDSGSTMYKNGQFNEACAAYRNGLKKMKRITADADITDTSIQDLKLSMHLNISLCHYRQGQWNETIRACNEALALKSENVKALFRRGVAYSRKGFLDEARLDLTKVCHKTPQDIQARGELKNVHDKLVQARQRDKKAFTGLFSKSNGFYEDREKEMEERKKKDAERLQQQKEEYTLENKKREEKGESPLPAFDVWQKAKTDTNAPLQPPATAPVTNTSSTKTSSNGTKTANTSSIHTDDFDEEDRKIMEETKKMGYCYFNRPVTPEIKKSYATKTQPIRVESTNHPPSSDASREATNDKPASACSLSSWNNKGTTYEEKDCSTWVCKTLRDHLNGLCVSNNKNLDINHLTKVLENATAGSKQARCEAEPSMKALESLIHVLPWTCKVTSVDTVEGDAQIVVLRASKRYLYDLKITLSFTLTIPEMAEPTKDAACYHGTLSLEDVSTASSWSTLKKSTEDTCQVDWLNDAKVSWKSSLSSLHEPIWKIALESLKKELYRKVETFNELFHSYA